MVPKPETHAPHSADIFQQPCWTTAPEFQAMHALLSPCAPTRTGAFGTGRPPLRPMIAREVACMAKKKGTRIIVTLECTEARGEGKTPSRYTTQKVRGGGDGASRWAAGLRCMLGSVHS